MLRPVQPHSSTLRSVPTTRPAPPDSGPVDAFQPSERPSGLGAAARLLDSQLRLKKGETPYKVVAWCPGPQGGVLAAYAEPEPGLRSYVACVRADGAVTWEVPFVDGRVKGVSLLSDGTVAVGTSSGAAFLSPEGRVLDRADGVDAVGLWADSSGTRYLLDGTTHRLSARGKDGAPVALPKELVAAEVLGVRATEDGGLLARTAGDLYRVAPGGGSAEKVALPEWKPEKNTKHSAVEAWPLDGGDIMVEKRSVTTVYPPFHHGMEHDPMFGGANLGFYLQPDITTVTSLVRLAPDGEVRWQAEGLGEDPHAVVQPDGTVYVLPPKDDDEGAGIRKVSAKGRKLKGFRLPRAATELAAGTEGTVLVRHGDTVSRRSPAGKALASVELEAEQQGFRLRGEAPGGRLIFEDGDGASLWACHLETGQWTRVTDPVGDHSVQVTLENLETEAGPSREVRQEDEWIVIGGVSLPVRRE